MEPSTSSGNNEETEKKRRISCQICTYPSHGSHFGVAACRACAAFFRRTLVADVKQPCKTGKHECPIDQTERFYCRACRFNKCLKAGMCPHKIQQNRDPISSTIQSTFEEKIDKENVKKTEKVNSKRKFLKYAITDTRLYNFELLMADIRQIFSENDTFLEDADYSRLCTLKKMDYGLRVIRRNQKRRFIEIANTMRFEDLTEARCGLIKHAAKWFMYAANFRKLTEKEKIMILKTTWHVWARLERLSMSVELLGEKVVSEKVLFTSDSDALYLVEVVHHNLSRLGTQEFEQVDRLLQPLFSVIFDELAVKLLDLKPSSIETAYMLCQIVFCVSGKTLTGCSLEGAERFMETISSDLHDYYATDLKLEKYAGRTLKMMSIVTVLQKTYIDYQKVMSQADAFRKIGDVDLCE
ncbi:unnamed protein product [Caenorhabditis sp. 36 PRJEB53466]|nr:unnamed protein product [Caenorhabditis sp. 36 PRJEB53466]